jgi:hypothetical protein
MKTKLHGGAQIDAILGVIYVQTGVAIWPIRTGGFQWMLNLAMLCGVDDPDDDQMMGHVAPKDFAGATYPSVAAALAAGLKEYEKIYLEGVKETEGMDGDQIAALLENKKPLHEDG